MKPAAACRYRIGLLWRPSQAALRSLQTRTICSAALNRVYHHRSEVKHRVGSRLLSLRPCSFALGPSITARGLLSSALPFSDDQKKSLIGYLKEIPGTSELVTAVQKGDAVSLVASLDSVVSSSDLKPAQLEGLLSIYLTLDEQPKFIKFAKQAVAEVDPADPQFVELCLRLIILLNQYGFSADCQQICSIALQKGLYEKMQHPQDLSMFLGAYGNSLQILGRHKDAAEVLRGALNNAAELRGVSPAHDQAIVQAASHFAFSLKQLGRLRESLGTLFRFENPELPYDHAVYCEMFQMLAATADSFPKLDQNIANRILEAAIKKDPLHPFPFVAFASLKAEAHDWAQACFCIDQAAQRILGHTPKSTAEWCDLWQRLKGAGDHIDGLDFMWGISLFNQSRRGEAAQLFSALELLYTNSLASKIFSKVCRQHMSGNETFQLDYALLGAINVASSLADGKLESTFQTFLVLNNQLVLKYVELPANSSGIVKSTHTLERNKIANAPRELSLFMRKYTLHDEASWVIDACRGIEAALEGDYNRARLALESAAAQTPALRTVVDKFDQFEATARQTASDWLAEEPEKDEYRGSGCFG